MIDMIGMSGRRLSVADVATELGLSEPTVRRWARSRKLPAYKPGRAYWVDEQELTDFIRKSRIGAGAAAAGNQAVCG